MSDDEQQTDDEDLKKFKDLLVEIHASQFSSGAAYTNLVSIGGYAGVFAIWNFVRPNLSAHAMVLVAALLAVSLMTFIFWNVFQMIWLASTRFSWTSTLQGLPPKDFIDKYVALEEEQKRQMFGWYIKLWAIALIVSISTALIAMLLLIYDCGAELLGFPQWPR